LAPDLPKGLYTVTWRAISADSHPVAGLLYFWWDLRNLWFPSKWRPWIPGGYGVLWCDWVPMVDRCWL
ncbi:MAG: copper resistance protein CopC, partial [Synechococcaceae cyanobacterium RM1_1_27]|nr:copper resistance protein CopC [Synechococcaceae cyanobacterium RM1_1_27]